MTAEAMALLAGFVILCVLVGLLLAERDEVDE